MKKLIQLIIVGSLVVLMGGVMSCEDEPNTVSFGTYEGTFIVEYSADTLSGPISLTLASSRYNCSSNPDRIPPGGSGEFVILTDSISFTDENAWTADFDWNLILNGTYHFESVGDSLILSADKNGVGRYRYLLSK